VKVHVSRLIRDGAASCLAAFALSACAAHTPAPLVVRYAELGHGAPAARPGQPVVLEFEKGDRIPVNLAFQGQLFELAPEHPPIDLVARRHCFVRADARGIHGSLDGNFDEKPLEPGKFSLFFEITRQAAALNVSVTSPRLRESR
jgi:hypothetical protein